jgi:hypothetical protein
MKNLSKKIEYIFDVYIWPFFVNGQKQEEYFEKLREKYNVDENGNPNPKDE